MLLGGNADQLKAQFVQEGEAAIEREFMTHGDANDKNNFQKVRDGTFGDGVTLDALMQHPSTVTAHLERYHVLALRLYTTSSYARVNDPLRTSPPTRPHPFAATTYFIYEGIKKLRHVEAKTEHAQVPRDLWRGVHGLNLTPEFMKEGGSEYACMSTSASMQVAANFAKQGSNPMIFKYSTTNCIERGADVSFLSVYKMEEEVLFPPLTFLRFGGVQQEVVAGTSVLVISVKAQIVGN